MRGSTIRFGWPLAAMAVLFFCGDVGAATRYVDAQNGSPESPFTNWATAASTIQDAVDAAEAGDLVLVTNGLYNVGARVTPARSLLNRVLITNAITVRSVNGPDSTVISGAPDPDTGGLGTGAVRCVYIVAGAELSGFTLTNGWTFETGTYAYDLSGASVVLHQGGVVTNCIIRGNRSSYYGAGSYCRNGGLVVDCLIEANQADDTGGGGFCFAGGEYRDCVLRDNTATNNLTGGNAYAGGIYVHQDGVVVNCRLERNSARYGGALFASFGGVVDRCAIVSNRAVLYGGGVYTWNGGVITNSDLAWNDGGTWGGGCLFYDGGFITDSTLSNNTATSYGGGLVIYSNGAARSCTFSRNHSGFEGGGVFMSSVINGSVSNCTVEENDANSNGGGAFVYFGGEIYDSTFLSNRSYSGAGVYLENSGRIVRGFLRGNVATFNGGGVYFNQGGIVSACTLLGNEASQGGGAYTLNGGLIDNSLLVGNFAQQGGGLSGVSWLGTTGTAVNCTVVSNAASDQGGGVFESSLANCIVSRNSAANDAPNWKDSMLSYCCTTPMPTGTVGSITNEPLFMDPAAGDWRPRFGSPVINAGDTLSAAGAVDISGWARISGSSVDMGAHEYDGDRYDSDGDIMTDAWETRYGLNPTNAADASLQGDDDGIPNREEFVADTNPTNGNSYFRIFDAAHLHSFDVMFACSTARIYTLQFVADLSTGMWANVAGAVDVPGAPEGTLTFTDMDDAAFRHYRVGVRRP